MVGVSYKVPINEKLHFLRAVGMCALFAMEQEHTEQVLLHGMILKPSGQH